jgi:hypothetical protein
LPGGHSEWEPPDPIPNSEVKTLCADGSVPFRHARVGHRQASNKEPLRSFDLRGFLLGVSSDVIAVQMPTIRLRPEPPSRSAAQQQHALRNELPEFCKPDECKIVH